MEERPFEEIIIHQEVIDLLKRSMYNYPNATHPSLMTFINHPVKHKAVTDLNGNEFYPDIVIINSVTYKIVMIGEVETASSLNKIEVSQWENLATLTPVFYIFYPRGYYAKMRELCKKIPVTGFFEYQKENNRYTIARQYPF